MKKNKKMIIPIVLLLVFFTAIFSNYVMETFPIVTISSDLTNQYSRFQLIEEFGIPIWKTNNHMFVYNTVSHENWSDYTNN